MADQKIVNYFNENLARGYHIEQIKKNLIQNGYNQKQVDDAAKQAATNMPNAPSPPKSSKIVFWVVGILLVIILLAGIGGYYFYKQLKSFVPESIINQESSNRGVAASNSGPIESISDYSFFKDEITCGKGYIRHATGCCADSNSNNICDVDDGIIKQEDPLKLAAKLNCGKKLAKWLFFCCLDTNENGRCDAAEGKQLTDEQVIDLGLSQYEFLNSVYDCKVPYIKSGEQHCCLDINNDNVCDLPFDITIKSAEAKHVENNWNYKLDKLIVDYNAKKGNSYELKFEAYGNKGQLVSSDSESIIFFAEGAKTNLNILNYAKIEFQDPGVYTLKIKFLKGNNVEAGFKETKILVGTAKENPAGPQFSAEVLNFHAKQQSCYWIYPQYSLNIQNSGDTDAVYALKKTYTIDGSLIKENTPRDDKPRVAKASSSEKTDFSDMSEPTKQCYTGKTLKLKLDFLDRNGNAIASKEASSIIEKS